MAFFDIYYTILLVWNDIVFNGNVWDLMQVCDNLKLIVASWARALWPKTNITTLDIFRKPKVVILPKKPKRLIKGIEWRKPKASTFKSNMDSAAKGSSREVGIGGVLKDENGAARIVFSKSNGIADANQAKVCAIKEAMTINVVSRCTFTHHLMVESDSLNSIKWVTNPVNASWKFRRWIT